jgi:hypothetical protein
VSSVTLRSKSPEWRSDGRPRRRAKYTTPTVEARNERKPTMAVLHYGTQRIELSARDVQKFVSSHTDLSKPSFHTVELDAGVIHFVTGPGVSLLIDDRSTAAGPGV